MLRARDQARSLVALIEQVSSNTMAIAKWKAKEPCCSCWWGLNPLKVVCLYSRDV